MAKTCLHGEENCNRCAMNDVVALPIHLHLILDVSPSMRGRWTQTLSGLNEYLDSLRADQKDNNQDYKVSMTTFSADITHLHKDVELDTLPTFTRDNLSPEGNGTALYDAIGPEIEAISTTEPILVLIITDGEENSSIEWDKAKLATLMDARAKLGNYTYAYLGVAKEAWGNATKMGKTVAASSSNISAEKYGAGTYASLAGLTRSYSANMRVANASGHAMSVSNFFSSEENSSAVQPVPLSTTTPNATPDGDVPAHWNVSK